jgi:hypothetical protein
MVKQKEPWEMTQKEYLAANPQYGIVSDWDDRLAESSRAFPDVTAFRDKGVRAVLVTESAKRLEGAVFAHRGEVIDAILAGKPVPAEVLADYPDLRELRPEGESGDLQLVHDSRKADRATLTRLVSAYKPVSLGANPRFSMEFPQWLRAG